MFLILVRVVFFVVSVGSGGGAGGVRVGILVGSSGGSLVRVSDAVVADIVVIGGVDAGYVVVFVWLSVVVVVVVVSVLLLFWSLSLLF